VYKRQSWCWGFSPVISQIKKNYADRLNIALVMGGLQAGESNVLSTSSREEIFHHWHQVEKTTGQPFMFENALPKGFVYNTEPACRAVITVASIDPSKTFEYFTAVQNAFYAKNQDVTQTECLAKLATTCGIEADRFNEIFIEEAQHDTAQKNFQFTKKAGVQGFPTLILNIGEELQVLTRGYQDYQNISISLNKLLTS